MIGSKVDDLVDEENFNIPEALSLLVGKHESLQVVHETRPGYEQAYRKVIKLRPAVSTQLTQNRIPFKREAQTYKNEQPPVLLQ